MVIKSKDELVQQIYSLRMAAIYDIFAQICLHEFVKKWDKGETDPDELPKAIFPPTEIFPEGEITFRQFMEHLSELSNVAQVETKRNANRFLTRNHLKEVFRITQSYCQQAEQDKAMRVEPWYRFARVIVNSLSHDWGLHFTSNDKKILPVSYKGETIAASMDGQTLHIKLDMLVALTDDIMDFAKNLPT